jgi:beta-phosphoglucomutase-like phosphatase (HAD superfamily)
MRALIFDLDGTLIDSVYAHVIAWQKSFATEDMHVPPGLYTRRRPSGEELAIVIGREGINLFKGTSRRSDKRHGDIMKELLPQPKPMPERRCSCGACGN